jgi:hypothetical protein
MKSLLVLTAVHLLLTAMVAGLVLGRWPLW